jgi:hypothetical protein
VPITAAGGDSGYGVNSPASNPHLIAVGGTSLQRATNARGWTDAVWYSQAGGEGLGTGSGCSEEAKPAWQADGGCTYRTTNDVAAVADPNTPVSTYDSYQALDPWRLAGGTSAATPIVAAAMALADPYTRSFDGAQALYLDAAANGTGVLDDVTFGSNGSCGSYLCEAGVGYDGPSGLGSLYGAPTVSPQQVHLPIVQTQPASAVTQTSATLNATVNPNGGPVTRCAFYLGSSNALIPCASVPAAGSSPVAVRAPLTGLLPGTTYRYRIVASNASGTSSGETLGLTTLGVVQGQAGFALLAPEPATGTTPAPPHVSARAVYATLAVASLTASATGGVRVKIACPPQKAACAGTITLRSLRAIAVRLRRHRVVRRVVTLAAGPFRVPAGRVAIVTLRLSAAARAVFAHVRLLQALAIVNETDRAGAAHAANSTVRIREVGSGEAAVAQRRFG